jgi:protein pelota
MKLLRRAIDRDGHGDITMIPEEAEDMWHVYNFVVVGDNLTATTVRRVQKETDTSSMSDRKRIRITIQVESVSFNPGAESMRISGRNSRENQYMKLGAYHTIDLELNKKVAHR